MEYSSYTDPAQLVPGWLLKSTPPGLFVCTEIASQPVWVSSTGCGISLDEGPGQFMAWELTEDDHAYAGVFVGKTQLAIDPTSLSRGDREVDNGDLVIKHGRILLVSAPDIPGGRRTHVDVGATGTSERVPHVVRCSRWALMMDDIEGDQLPVFEHGRQNDEAAAD